MAVRFDLQAPAAAPRKARAARVHRRLLPAGFLALALAAGPAAAQSAAASRDPALPAAVSPAAGIMSAWADVIRGAVRDAFAPLRAGFAGMMQATGASSASSGGLVLRTYPTNAVDLFDAASGGEVLKPVWYGTQPWRPDLTDDGGSGILLSPRRFAMPWLVAPDNVFHEMPAVGIADLGTMHVDLVGATIGGRTGTIVGQFSYRF